jgi:hypothetical protein
MQLKSNAMAYCQRLAGSLEAFHDCPKAFEGAVVYYHQPHSLLSIQGKEKSGSVMRFASFFSPCAVYCNKDACEIRGDIW